MGPRPRCEGCGYATQGLYIQVGATGSTTRVPGLWWCDRCQTVHDLRGGER